MADLKTQACEACRSNAPQVMGEELKQMLSEVPDWALVEKSGEQQLERTFKFKDFAQALAFTQQVGDLAESEDHHPAILTEYGKTTVNWWTHKIGGLHRNDFIMAARTDDLFSS